MQTFTIRVTSILFLSFILLFINTSATFPFIVKPVASQESLIVIKNSKVIFDVFLEGDENSKIKEIGLISKPEFGVVKVHHVDSMTYVPRQNVCEEIDHFSYFIRTRKGIDTVNVEIEILCESLTIINGFSPDGDGVQDRFTILGIENCPNNSLVVFNKWGEQIYARKGYKNDWDGRQKDGESLASDDSVYYYVFNDGYGQSYSGYLKIQGKS